ncbi:low-density lipoprotein receptor-related protein 6 [Elysia marginata]|uniref:Low-density lipoprotein receptor-related protein 6 n=1 Tax=Elysia marginata TaxID=1093978 RepID=A0AAV4GRG1_9GAST|nr:low-density lipoprotein receptor-related protein 6 [Elysia marginata]
MCIFLVWEFKKLEISQYPKQPGRRYHYLTCRARGGAEFHESIHWLLQRPGQYDLVNITHHLEQQQQQQGQHSDHMATRMTILTTRRWRIFVSRLVFKFVSREDAGTYFCQSSYLTSQNQRLVPQCGREQFECDNKCLDRDKVCDGETQCDDGSDEKECEKRPCIKLLDCKKNLEADFDLAIPQDIPIYYRKKANAFFKCSKKNAQVCSNYKVEQRRYERNFVTYLFRKHVVKDIRSSVCKEDERKYTAMLESVDTHCKLDLIATHSPCR